MARPQSAHRDVLTIREDTCGTPFFINGEPLTDLIERAASRASDTYRSWHKAGGFLPMGVRHWDNYITDDETRGREGLEVPVFSCNCGDWGCASVSVHIVVGPDTVVWRGLSISGSGGIPYLGPFVFDRRQYETAFGVERSRPGLREVTWHLGSTDEAGIHMVLVAELETLVAAIAAGDIPLPEGRRVERPVPTRADLEEYHLTPRDVFDFTTGEVGALTFTWWDETGPDDWVVTVRIFYVPGGAKLQLSEVRPLTGSEIEREF